MNTKKFLLALISIKRKPTTFKNGDMRQLTLGLRVQEIKTMLKTMVELRAHSCPKVTARCGSRQILPGGNLSSVSLELFLPDFYVKSPDF